ncbi:DNA cytosine methyltransferase [bacterium]|nr:DNA cytosine methyltransferase [bacterium]
MAEFYEFFAGGGMARLGLGEQWSCTYANDIDRKKAASYSRHFGAEHLAIKDVGLVATRELPGRASLAWASFPCQDLSLAGRGIGLTGHRSGTFWPFWALMGALNSEGRAPHTIVLENVYGAISSNCGRDFNEIGNAITSLGYRFGALVMDAVHFVPQSRPRLFIVAVRSEIRLPEVVTRSDPTGLWHPRSLVEAKFRMSAEAQDAWVWWNVPVPAGRETVFADLIEDIPTGVQWNSHKDTLALISMMSPVNRAKVRAAQREGVLRVGTLYKRTRKGLCRAEVRFDDVAGCLRTPSGGSSRQTIIVVKGRSVRTRLLSPREAARLMGLPEEYVLPSSYNEAYHLAGDGLVVPVVAHLADSVLTPIAQTVTQQISAA